MREWELRTQRKNPRFMSIWMRCAGGSDRRHWRTFRTSRCQTFYRFLFVCSKGRARVLIEMPYVAKGKRHSSSHWPINIFHKKRVDKSAARSACGQRPPSSALRFLTIQKAARVHPFTHTQFTHYTSDEHCDRIASDSEWNGYDKKSNNKNHGIEGKLLKRLFIVSNR